MRNGILPIPYITDHYHSRVVMGAVAEGLKRFGSEGDERSSLQPACTASWKPDPAIVYGILRGCGEIIRRCHLTGVDWWHIDLGYFGRNHYEGYYRLSKNSMQADWRRYTEARTEMPALERWRHGNEPILICPPTASFSHFHPTDRLDEDEWVDAVTRAIQVRTSKPLLIRHKGDDAEIGDPWCVVVHSSNIAIDALIQGTPAIALGRSVVRDWGPTIDDIDDPVELRAHSRETLLRCLSWHQFTLDEFRRGVPWQ